MKTKIMKFSLFAGIVLSLGALLGSCEQIKPDGPGEEDTDDLGNVFTTTSTVTPLRFTEMEYKGGETGVSIKVTKATADELVFTCKPGLDIQSYLVAAYPMSFIYDLFMDNMVGEGKEEYTVTEVQDLLRTLISNMDDTNATGRGRFVNERADDDEFYELEFDFMNAENRVFTVQPDMDYIIVAFGFFNANENWREAGFQDFADLCVCHVRTEAKEIVGNPRVACEIEAGFTAFSIKYIPNEDCQYFHYLTAPTESIDRYVNAYGDDMYCQLLCNIAGRVEKGDETNSTYRRTDAPKVEYTTTVVALDVNGTSQRKYNSYKFELNDIPENADKAECTIDYPNRIGGSIVEFDVHINANCKDVRYGIYPKTTVDEIMAKTDEEKKAYAEGMCYPTEANPVWGITNFNYSYDISDPENPLKNSRPMDVSDYQWELAGETEYRIVYAGYDRFNRPGELKATESFTTKKISRNNAENSKEDVVMSIPSTTRTSLTLHFEYTKDNTALYYFQYYSPMPAGDAGHTFPDADDTPEEARDKWMYMFLDFKNPDPFQTPWPNMWRDEGQGSIKIDYMWDGFGPATTYKFAYMGEDWEGNYGEIKFCEETTQAISAGLNPKIETIETKLTEDGKYTITYRANEETSEIRYMIVNENSAHYEKLGVKDFLKGYMTYEEVQAKWPLYIIDPNAGLDTPNLVATQTGELEGETTMAIAVAVGGTYTEDGQEKVALSPVSAVIIMDKDQNGKIEQSDIQTLEEFCGVEAAKSNRATATITLDTTPGVPMRFAVRPGNGAVRVKTF